MRWWALVFAACASSPDPVPLTPLVRLFRAPTGLGASVYGQDADGNVYGVDREAPMPQLRGAVRIASGMEGGKDVTTRCECATLADGSLACRGATKCIPGIVPATECTHTECSYFDNQCTRVSLGTYDCLEDWTVIPNTPNLVDFEWGCGIDRAHDVVCWNDGKWSTFEPTDDRQLVVSSRRGARAVRTQFIVMDDGTLVDRKTSARVATVHDVVDACGTTDGIACALSTSGEVWCWGKSGLLGSLDPGSASPRFVGSGFTALDCEIGLRCGLRADGVVCWGPFLDGGDTWTPTTIASTLDAREIAVQGLSQFFVRRVDGSVMALDGVRVSRVVRPVRP